MYNLLKMKLSCHESIIPLKELHYVKMSITLSGQIVGEQMHTAYCVHTAY